MDYQKWNEIRLASVHPIFAGRVRQLLAQLLGEGFEIEITQAMRTWMEQDALYAKGRTQPGSIVTKAPGGFSQHNFGLAVDVAPVLGDKLDWNVDHAAWKRTLEIAPNFKLAEGAKWRTFPDTPHLYPAELPGGCKDLRAQYQQGGMPAVWKYFESLVTP